MAGERPPTAEARRRAEGAVDSWRRDDRHCPHIVGLRGRWCIECLYAHVEEELARLKGERDDIDRRLTEAVDAWSTLYHTTLTRSANHLARAETAEQKARDLEAEVERRLDCGVEDGPCRRTATFPAESSECFSCLWDRAEAAERALREARQKLAIAGVEGSPPPGEMGTIPRLLQQLREARESEDGLRAEMVRGVSAVQAAIDDHARMCRLDKGHDHRQYRALKEAVAIFDAALSAPQEAPAPPAGPTCPTHPTYKDAFCADCIAEAKAAPPAGLTPVRVLPENNWREVWHDAPCRGPMKEIRGDSARIPDGTEIAAWECLACGARVFAGLDEARRIVHVPYPVAAPPPGGPCPTCKAWVLDVAGCSDPWHRATPPGGPTGCAVCGKPATCVGSYETPDSLTEEPACDECCGHGNEDGYCKPIPATPPSAPAEPTREEK